MLLGDSDSAPVRYLLGALCSALGLPFRFAGSPSDEGPGSPRGCVRLMVGAADGAPPDDSRGDSALLSPPVASELVAACSLLTRQEELRTPARDQHDRFGWEHGAAEYRGEAARPLVSAYAGLLLSAVRQACEATSLPMIRKEFWPGARPMAACLTHDVDVVRRGKLPRGVALRDIADVLASAARGRFGGAIRGAAAVVQVAASGQDPYWTFERISALEREHGYRSTYFFMAGRHHAQDASYRLSEPRVAKLLRALAASGCEVALHGSYATSANARLLRAQKESLESAVGGAVSGHRNHLLRFRVPESWLAQEAAGLSYDATLGFADREGFRGGHAFPFHPYDPTSGRTLELLEMPLAVMDVTLRKYRRLRGAEAEDATREVLKQTRSVNGLATLLWHNDSFCDRDYPGSGRLYEVTLAWLSENGAWVAPCREIDRWWRARQAVVTSPLPASREWRGWRVEVPLEIEGLVLRVSSPDPDATPRLAGEVAVSVRRDGRDHLLELGRLPPGSSFDVECP